MPLVGAAIIPTAPLLVPGVSATLPDGVAEVRTAVDAALRDLPRAETVVLLAAASEPGVYEKAEASLAGFGRPDLAASVPVADAEGLSGPHRRDGPLPPGLAVLALLFGERAPVVPIAVDAQASARMLAARGAAIAGGSNARRIVVLAAGDLSAGLDERSPRYHIEGAVAWDERAVVAISDHDPDALAALGPDEARRVGALGWAPMVVVQAACVQAGLSLEVRRYSAPRGVGYLVAGVRAEPGDPLVGGDRGA